jgi:hypothetical protein
LFLVVVEEGRLEAICVVVVVVAQERLTNHHLVWREAHIQLLLVVRVEVVAQVAQPLSQIFTLALGVALDRNLLATEAELAEMVSWEE